MRESSIRRGSAPLAIAVTALLLVGCATAIGGQPEPAPSEEIEAKSDEQLPHSGAPKVLNPLDATKLRRAQQDPCSTLTGAQVSELGLDPKGQFENAEAGPLCDWSDIDAGSSASVYFPTEVIDEGLSRIYLTHNRDRLEDYFFLMPPVNGFPVLASAAVDSRDDGSCGVQVGLTDKHIAYVNVLLSRANRGQVEPCEKARDVAEMAVTTMKGGA